MMEPQNIARSDLKVRDDNKKRKAVFRRMFDGRKAPPAVGDIDHNPGR
jgi:hypothetical protein